ncbi:MAG: hypothetical protein QOH46_3723, partial [Solirubrobacteraceae bacterium]|nr:hypothetical protein [Solirubrobacteraceae bacterium]
ELSPEPYTGADEHVERAEEDAARGSQENDVPREEQAVEPWAEEPAEPWADHAAEPEQHVGEPSAERQPEALPEEHAEPSAKPGPTPAQPTAWSGAPAVGDESDPRAAAWQPPPATAAGESGRAEPRGADGAPEAAWHDATDYDVPADGSGTRAGEPQETEPFDALGADARRRTVSLPRPQTDPGEWDAPIGTVRVSRAGGYQTQPGASGYPAYRKLGVQKPRRRWLRRIIALLALAAVVAVGVFLYLVYEPAHGPGHGQVQVRIPEGATASQIGDILEQRGVVDSGFFFSLRARLSGQREHLRSGRYTLRESMPYDAALVALTTAPKAVPILNVTLPEGPSRREAAPLVRRAGVRGDYLAATRRSSRLRPRDYGAPSSTNTLEGFLYPATYELRRNQATAGRLVNSQVAAFKEAFAKVDMREARRKNLTRYDVLIIASMIEREGLIPRERRLISAVIYNRLKQGIPLGIDATIRYALNNWSSPLRVSELQSDTPFNTRRRKGLPPTPIGNPGLPAIRAAANPANVDYLFYVVKPCGNGAHAFSATDAQFQRDVAAYNRARDRRGGKDPSRC